MATEASTAERVTVDRAGPKHRKTRIDPTPQQYVRSVPSAKPVLQTTANTLHSFPSACVGRELFLALPVPKRPQG